MIQARFCRHERYGNGGAGLLPFGLREKAGKI